MKDQDYDLELASAVSEISKRHARNVMIQLGDGLKPRAEEIQDFLKKSLPDVNIFFWLNSCYGKCDIPEFLNNSKEFDLLIQFGH